MIGLVAFLIVLGGAALIEHNHIDGWVHRRAQHHHPLGRRRQVRARHHVQPGHARPCTPARRPPRRQGEANALHGDDERRAPAGPVRDHHPWRHKSFTVKVLAVSRPCWVDATAAGPAHTAVRRGLLPGQTHSFVVTESLTVETGSAAGRALQFYEGFKLLGYFFPPKAPFTMNFTAAG